MGASGAGIIIRTKNVEDIDIKKLLESVIGKETEKGGFCDLRNEGCFYLGKTKNSISILNSDLAERFFTAKDTSEIQDILTKLPENDLIYAFEEYDSGGTYSYATIRNNKFDRRFRSLTYETTIDEGELEEREVAWNNSKKEKTDPNNENKLLLASVDIPKTISVRKQGSIHGPLGGRRSRRSWVHRVVPYNFHRSRSTYNRQAGSP